MSVVIVPPHAGVRRLAISTVVACLLALGSVAVTSAQDLPPCDDRVTASECRLPAWPEEELRDAPSLFGDVTGTVWLEDAVGDAPAAGLDILAVGIGSVNIDDPRAVRDAEGLLKTGKAKQAVRPGDNVLVRIVLDSPLDQIEAGHSGVHIATDIDASRSNNAPAGVRNRRQPFAGSEDIYSVTYATTTGKTSLQDSDLSSRWYKGKDAFAAAWASPTVLDVLVRPEGFGSGFRVITFTSGADGGYDSLTLGPGAIPVDGVVPLRPACLEASVAMEPLVVRRLVENGQTLRDVEALASWRAGASFAVDDETRQALESLISELDEDGDGRIGLASSANLFEDGVVIGHRPELGLALVDGQAQLALELGLTRRGYNVLRAIELEPTGNDVADAWLARATEALTEAMPPFRSARRAGPLVGDAIGGCATALIEPPPPEPEETAAPEDEPPAPEDEPPAPEVEPPAPGATPAPEDEPAAPEDA